VATLHLLLAGNHAGLAAEYHQAKAETLVAHEGVP
jgi:hypothetical protein